jgi:arsenate reductase
MTRVLFACVHNAGRSQMAAAFLRVLADPARVEALSAGTDPAAQVHPGVRAAMAELGIDLSEARPTRLTPALAASVQLLVTMGCGDACPVLPGTEVLDWPLPDPRDASPDAVRAIRDTVRARVAELVAARGWARSG